MNDLPRPAMTAQECRKQAELLVVRAWSQSRGPYENEERANLLREAQVWATLATVPEPLVEFQGQLIESSTSGADLPVLTCPHGYQANVYPLEAEGRTVQFRYSWRDCPHVSCP